MVVESDGCRFRLLGPVQVVRDGGPVTFSRRQQRDLLALLLLNVERVVPVDQIVDAMWGDAVPATASTQIKNMVSALRRALVDGPRALATVDRHPAGYRLRVTDGRLDLELFTTLLADARTAATPELVARTLRRACGLWKGSCPLGGVRAPFADAARTHLQEMRNAALEDMFEAELACGNHAEIVAELTQAVADHPGRESPVGQLMVALYRSGRSADALGTYQRARQTLTDEYGLEPSAGLRDLEQLILLGKPVPDRPLRPAARVRHAAPPAEPTPPVPAQLPHDVSGFIGRDVELARLHALLHHERRPPAAIISALMGPAGIGKTALAVHWAHQVAGAFPDGQLYMNLRGFDPGGSPMSPTEALRGFLDAFAVPPDRIPAGVEAQAAQYRSLLAGRQMLVVLDNAANAEQISPLLPGASGSLALVTSRTRLVSLVALEGALPIALEPLSDVEARDLLTARLGERVAAEESAAAQIITKCAGLPLALAVVAGRAAVHPTLPLAGLAAELTDARGVLEALAGPDASVDVRTVFSWSYLPLSGGAARLFRLLGLSPGPDIALTAAASLAGQPTVHVRRLLAELADAHLVIEHPPGRFAVHDLFRAYATELARSVDDVQTAHAAGPVTGAGGFRGEHRDPRRPSARARVVRRA